MSEPHAALTAEAEALLVRIAPHELAAHPVYVIAKSDVPADFGGGSAWGGWTHPLTDLHMRDVIGERWKGRGPAVVVDGRDRENFLGHALHEFAHRIDTGLIAEPPAGFDPASSARQSAVSMEGNTAAAVQLAHHSPAWVRVAMHLAHRANAAGVQVAADVLGYSWLVPMTVDFFRVLYSEMTAHLGRPLADLKRTPPPPKLLDLWHLAAARCEDIAPTVPTISHGGQLLATNADAAGRLNAPDDAGGVIMPET